MASRFVDGELESVTEYTPMKRALFLLMVLSASAQAMWGQAAQNPTPGTFFGENLSANTFSAGYAWPAPPMGAIRLWDSGTRWNQIETSQGNYTWTTFDAWLAAAAANNVDVTYTFGPGTPTFYSNGSSSTCSYSPSSVCGPPGGAGCTLSGNPYACWDAWVSALVARANGKIKYWEGWNEFDIGQNYPQPADVPTMIVLMIRANGIIKTSCPTCVFVSPAIADGDFSSGGIMGRYLSGGGAAISDIVAFHGYIGYSSYAEPEAIASRISSAKALMNANGLSGHELWDTEASWGHDSNLASAPTCSGGLNSCGAGWLARNYLIHWSNGISRYYWYGYSHTSQIGTLWTPTPTANPGTLNPAGTAYGEVYNWIVGSTLTTPCASSSNTYTCGLTLSNGSQALAVWSTAGSASYAPAALFTQYKDLTGATHAVIGSITIGYAPVLFFGAGTTPPLPPTNLKATVQ